MRVEDIEVYFCYRGGKLNNPRYVLDYFPLADTVQWIGKGQVIVVTGREAFAKWAKEKVLRAQAEVKGE